MLCGTGVRGHEAPSALRCGRLQRLHLCLRPDRLRCAEDIVPPWLNYMCQMWFQLRENEPGSMPCNVTFSIWCSVLLNSLLSARWKSDIRWLSAVLQARRTQWRATPRRLAWRRAASRSCSEVSLPSPVLLPSLFALCRRLLSCRLILVCVLSALCILRTR